MSSAHRWQERRELRQIERRRRRGGDGRPPVVLQRLGSGVVNATRTVRYRIARATRGDRPLIVGLLAVIVVGVLLISGPAQNFLDGRSRVEHLSTTAAALDEANSDLQQRVDDLQDPAHVELLAREQQGFVRPGEVPYALVPPEVDRPRITAPRDETDAAPTAWYARVWGTVTAWFGS